MKDYSELFIHETDRAALKALKAVPGFDVALKKFMEVYSDKLMNVRHLSSCLRISEKQMPKYHNMLVDVCNKLGVEKPDFYLQLSYEPNAWTMGENKPIIVVTSALLETFPDELIPTILAHECGHIICHHVFYNTMLNLLVEGAFNFAKYSFLTEVAYDAIITAMRYWQRCSEISADRVAVVYDGKADKMMECCMRFCGYDKNIKDNFSFEEFLDQAKDYRKLVDDSKWNKTLEFLEVRNYNHPLSAVRALECEEWSKRDDFDKIMNLYKEEKTTDIPSMYSSSHFENMNKEEVVQEFIDYGFDTVNVERVMETKKKYQDDKVVEITINGNPFKQFEWFKNTDEVLIKYYQGKTDEEIALEHPGESKLPESLVRFKYHNVSEVVKKLEAAGFTNIVREDYMVKKSLFTKEYDVAAVYIDMSDHYQKGDWIKSDIEIIIKYNKYI